MATSKKNRPFNYGNSGLDKRAHDQFTTARKIAERRPARCLTKHLERAGKV